MADRIVPEDSQTIVLLESEWAEIESSVIAVHAALKLGTEDEEVELLWAAYLRLSRSIHTVNNRLHPDD